MPASRPTKLSRQCRPTRCQAKGSDPLQDLTWLMPVTPVDHPNDVHGSVMCKSATEKRGDTRACTFHDGINLTALSSTLRKFTYSSDLKDLRHWLEPHHWDADGKLNPVGFNSVTYYSCVKMPKSDFEKLKQDEVRVIPRGHPQRKIGMMKLHPVCCLVCGASGSERGQRHHYVEKHLVALKDTLNIGLKDILLEWWHCPYQDDCGFKGSARKESVTRHMRDFCPSAKTLGFSEAVYGAINAENAIHVLRTAKQKARSKRRVEGKRKVQTREEANRPATNSSQAGSGEDVLEGPFNPASILPSASCNTARILRLGDALPAPPLMASFAHNAQLADGMAEAFHIENGPMDWLNQVLCPLPHAPPEPLPSTPPSMGLDYVPGVSIYPETRLWHETNPTALGGLDLWEEYYSSGFGAACGSSVPSNLWDSLPSGEEHRDLLIPYSF